MDLIVSVRSIFHLGSKGQFQQIQALIRCVTLPSGQAGTATSSSVLPSVPVLRAESSVPQDGATSRPDKYGARRSPEFLYKSSRLGDRCAWVQREAMWASARTAEATSDSVTPDFSRQSYKGHLPAAQP